MAIRKLFPLCVWQHATVLVILGSNAQSALLLDQARAWLLFVRSNEPAKGTVGQ